MNPKISMFLSALGTTTILALSINCAQAGEHSDRNDRAERREARIEQRQHDRAEHQEHQGRQLDQQSAGTPEAQPEPPKKPARMTPEERRALRRQINEAGQDIYGRKN